MNMECRQNCMHQENGKCRVNSIGRRQQTACSPCPFYEKKIIK